VGDVNGDGFADVALAAPRRRGAGPDQGCVYVFRGGPSGVSGGDVRVLGGPKAGMLFGRGLAGDVDLDGDGLADFLVGGPRLTAPVVEGGGVWRVRGRGLAEALDPEPILQGRKTRSMYGSSISVTGDVNGDGYPDLMVGAPRWTQDREAEGAVFLYLGSKQGFLSTPAWSVLGGQDGAELGTAVSIVGDLNHDGRDDVAVGEPHYHGASQGIGRVRVYFGSAEGLRPAPDWTFVGSAPREGVGASIAARGDLNGDGRPDLVVGAPGNGEQSGFIGRVYLFLGAANGLEAGPARTYAGPHEGSGFGHTVAVVGDATGSGYAGLVIGAPYQRNPLGGQGRVTFHPGSPSGPVAEPQASFEGAFSRARFGWCVARAGDVNGDGLADFLIGSPYSSGNDGVVGRVDVIHGSRTAFARPVRLLALPRAPLDGLAASERGVTDPASNGLGAGLVARAAGTTDIPSGSGWRPILGWVLFAAASTGIMGLAVWRRQRLAAAAAVQAERARLARDLHDHVAPELTRLVLLESRAAGKGEAESEGGGAEAGPARQALQSMGELVWMTNPKNDTLDRFIAYLGDYTARFLEPAGLRLDLDLPLDPPPVALPPHVRQQLYVVVKEALNNIVKHAGATRVSLAVQLDGPRFSLRLADDGRGFDPGAIRAGANGLDNMRDRIEGIGGTFRVETSVGRGTEIRVDAKLR
jgi:signal transduction histidine kinase